MTVIYVSPTEPKPLLDFGVVDMRSEEYGCDIFWTVKDKTFGIQRKEFPQDFITSIHDGRLGEQIKKGAALDYMWLVLEGRPAWATNGNLIQDRGWHWNRTVHRKMLSSIQSKGPMILESDGVYDTIQVVEDLVAWSEKEEHTSLDKRPGPKKDKWGRRNNRSWQIHVIQSLPDVGPKQAEAIIDTVGFPFALSVTTDELLSVPGIGKRRAEKIIRVFES